MEKLRVDLLAFVTVGKKVKKSESVMDETLVGCWDNVKAGMKVGM